MFAKILRGRPNFDRPEEQSRSSHVLVKTSSDVRSSNAVSVMMASQDIPQRNKDSQVEDESLITEIKSSVNFQEKLRFWENTFKDSSNPIKRSKERTSVPAVTKKSDVELSIQKDILEEIRQGKYKMKVAPSDLIDFGGQKSFDMTHQLFIRQKGSFVIMFDGRYQFDIPLKEYPQGNITNRSKYFKTYIDLASYCIDFCSAKNSLACLGNLISYSHFKQFSLSESFSKCGLHMMCSSR